MKILSSFRAKLNKAKESLYLKSKRSKFHNDTVSIICNDCVGGVIYHRLGCRFNSPFINLFIDPKDFIFLVQHLNEYMNLDIIQNVNSSVSYPQGEFRLIKPYNLKPITLNFMHYQNFVDAQKCWNRRKARIDYNNLRFILDLTSSQYVLTEEEIKYLNTINSIVLLKENNDSTYANIEKSFVFKNVDEKPGRILNYKNGYKRYIDDFDYIKFLN